MTFEKILLIIGFAVIANTLGGLGYFCRENLSKSRRHPPLVPELFLALFSLKDLIGRDHAARVGLRQSNP